jgi:hypothetical protein
MAYQVHGFRGMHAQPSPHAHGHDPCCAAGLNISQAVEHANVSYFQALEGYYQAAADSDLLLVVGFASGNLLTRFPGSAATLPKMFAYHLARFGCFPISYLFTQEYNIPDGRNVSEMLSQGWRVGSMDPLQRALTVRLAPARRWRRFHPIASLALSTDCTVVLFLTPACLPAPGAPCDPTPRHARRLVAGVVLVRDASTGSPGQQQRHDVGAASRRGRQCSFCRWRWKTSHQWRSQLRGLRASVAWRSGSTWLAAAGAGCPELLPASECCVCTRHALQQLAGWHGWLHLRGSGHVRRCARRPLPRTHHNTRPSAQYQRGPRLAWGEATASRSHVLHRASATKRRLQSALALCQLRDLWTSTLSHSAGYEAPMELRHLRAPRAGAPEICNQRDRCA